MGVLFLDPSNILWVYPGIERAIQPRFGFPIQFFQLIPKELAKFLAAIYRLAVRRGAIDHCRQRFHQLPKKALSFS
ncbi:hypothetical protein D3C80_1154660 [compost metagenome]